MGLVYSPTWMVDFYGKCRYTVNIPVPWILGVMECMLKLLLLMNSQKMRCEFNWRELNKKTIRPLQWWKKNQVWFLFKPSYGILNLKISPSTVELQGELREHIPPTGSQSEKSSSQNCRLGMGYVICDRSQEVTSISTTQPLNKPNGD